MVVMVAMLLLEMTRRWGKKLTNPSPNIHDAFVLHQPITITTTVFIMKIAKFFGTKHFQLKFPGIARAHYMNRGISSFFQQQQQRDA